MKPSLHPYFFLFLPWIMLASCIREVPPKTPELPLVYNPIGASRTVTNAELSPDKSLFAIVNDYILTKTNSSTFSQQWDIPMDAWCKDLITCKNGSAIVVKEAAWSGEVVSLSRVSNEGNLLFNGFGSKLFPEYPNDIEHFISACSDGENGIYFVVALQEQGTRPEFIQKEKVFLLHFNEANVIDMKVSMKGYFIKISRDESGQLYGLSYLENQMNQPGSDGIDTFIVTAFDSLALKNKEIKYNWITEFTQPDYYAYFYWQLEFALVVNQQYVFVALPQIRWLNLEIGLDVLAYDKSQGKLQHRIGVPSPTIANKYHEGARLNAVAGLHGCYAVYRIGGTTQLVQMNNVGQIARKIDLKGQLNRCDILDMVIVNDQIFMFGKSSVGRSPQYTPFIYVIPDAP